MLNWIEIWWLGRCIELFWCIIEKPDSNNTRIMLGIVVLLENPLVFQAQAFHRWIQILFQYCLILISVHNAFNKNQLTNSRCRHSSPYHNTAPTPYFTVGIIFLGSWAVLGFRQTLFRPTIPKILYLLSSVNKSFFQKTIPFCKCALAKSRRSWRFLAKINCFLHAVLLLKPLWCKMFITVLDETVICEHLARYSANFGSLIFGYFWTSLRTLLISRLESFFGLPDRVLFSIMLVFLWFLITVYTVE